MQQLPTTFLHESAKDEKQNCRKNRKDGKEI
jgi:hypothetical protein